MHRIRLPAPACKRAEPVTSRHFRLLAATCKQPRNENAHGSTHIFNNKAELDKLLRQKTSGLLLHGDVRCPGR